MSYINPPRLTFSGESYANASTANNNDIASVYDIDTMTLNPQMGLMSGGQSVDPPPPGGNTFAWGGPTDNPGLRTWLMGLMAAAGVDNVGQAQMAHWNYYGDHSTKFQNTVITDAVMETGAAAADDAVRGVQVELLGNIFYGKRRGAVLVDVDPYALVTSQVFSGQFRLTYNASNNESIPLLEADNPTVAYSYFINPFKNLNPSCTGFEPVSAIFQFGLPLDGLNFHAGANFASTAFTTLAEKAKAAGGLMVRFCLYDAIFQISAPDLYADFAKGDYVVNPYQGRVLGSIGVWNPGEVPNAPPGRKLSVQSRFAFTPPPPDLAPADMAVKQKRMAMVAKYHVRKKSAAAAAAPPTATLGITLACVDTAQSVVSLDCISTFPEANIKARDKYDLGPINLLLFYGNPPGASVVVGPVPYDKATYESGGGVVDISYAANPQKSLIDANIATGRLALNSATLGNLLFETAGTDTQTADRAVYFDAQVGQGPNAPAGTSQIALQVTCKGAAPTAPVTLNLEYWMCEKDLVNPDKPQVPVVNPYFSVAGAVNAPNTPYTLGYLAGNPSYPNGVVSVLTQSVQVPAGGQLTLQLTALRPGVSMIRFVDPNLQPAPSPNFAWDNCDFAIVRILPYDDYSTYSDQQINNWPFIYANFFGFYSVLYPAMSKIIPWGPTDAPDDPVEVTKFATQMLAFTNPQLWHSTIYMPITRDLSGGKRDLLWRWCNLQLQQPT